METGADMVAIDTDAGIDELDLGAEGDGVSVGDRCEFGIDGVDQAIQEALDLLVGSAGSDSGDHSNEHMGGVAVGDPVVATFGGSGSQAINCGEAISECGGVNGFHQGLDVVHLGEVRAVLDDDVGHGSLRDLAGCDPLGGARV